MKGKLCFKGNILFCRRGASFHALWASALLILSILFYSCDFGLDGNSFQNKAAAYFKEMTSTAAVAAYSMDMADVLVDKDGNFCFGYDEDKTITFTLRNPMRYSFVSGQNMSVELAPGSGASLQKKDLVTIRQDAADSSTIYLTFPAEFLKANPLGADITPTIALRHPVSLTPFPLYDSLKLSSNAPPPMPSGALTMQTTETPSRWVLCFNLPKKAMVQTYHSDIVSVSINGKPIDAAVASDGTVSYAAGSGISTVAPSNIVANQNTGLSFNADENAAYYPTGDEADEKEKIYTVVVTDKAGLSSSLAISTRGFKLGSPDAFAKADTGFANKFKVYDAADPDGTKNTVEQDEDDSVYVSIKAVAKTASFDYTDPVTGETKHVGSYDYDKSDASVNWEVYRDEDCLDFVSAGTIKGLQGLVTIPAGTSFVRAYVRKPLYSDSEIIKWKCRAVFTRFYVSEDGDDNAEGSRKSPFRTIQRAVDAFVDGIASGDCVADSLCDIRVMTDLTTPDSYDFSAHGGYLLNVADPSLASATIKVSGLGGTKTISASQAGSAVRKLVNAAVGKTVIQNINLTGGAALVTDDYIDSALILAAGAELDFNGSKVYGNTLSGERDSSANEGSVILSEGILKMSGTTVCDNAGLVTGSGSEAPVFYALWSCSGSAAASELTDCEFSGHGEGWTVVYVDSLPVKMTGGAIKNNVGCDAAVESTERVELSGVEISGNVCKKTAIDNYNDLILDGCTITGNVSKAAPASGKAAGVSLGALVSSMSITLKGANTIYDNHFESVPDRQSNLYIPYGKKITVGANISGSKIGVTMPFNDTTKPTKETPVVFTTGYATPSYANPATPGSVFVSENDYGVAAIPSGVTDAGEAAFAVSSGGMYGPYDYTITTSAPSVVVAPGEAKSLALTTTVTRKEPAGSTPPETTLYYNPADRKLYLEDTFVTLAVEDRADDPDYNKVSWTAALYAGTSKACDVPISSSASGLTAEVPAMDLEYDYSLRITADFLGAGNHASFVYKVKNPFVSVAGASFDGSSAVTDSGVFIGGRKMKIKSLIVCDHEVTQKEWLDVTGKALSAQAGTSAILTEGDEIPMYYVNWFDALVYCNKKSAADGLTPCYTISGSTNPDSWGDVPTSESDPTYAAYKAVACDWNANGWRLPTEVEWEYLARGGNLSSTGQTKYSGSGDANAVSWHKGNTPASGQPGYGPQAVRTKAPNALGLYDMTGNVFEWCWDCYSSVAADVPITGPVVDTNNRNARGGSWSSDTGFLPFLELKTRTFTSMFARANNYGLRVVRSEDTATSYVLPTYCGSKEPGEALAVGDIVFDDGSATPYAAGLTLNDAQKARAIAVIYYTGSGSAGSYDLGEKTLGVGIKEWKYDQELRLNGSSDSTTPKWSINAPENSGGSQTGNGADKIIVPNEHYTIIEHQRNGLLTLALMKENVAEYNVSAGNIPDSPVFYWAEHYGEGDDKIAGNTALSSPYNSGWYLPGLDELMAIWENKNTIINPALGAIGSSAVQIAVGSTDNDRVYHSATGTNQIYAANLYNKSSVASTWRGKAYSVRAVRLFP